MKTAVSIPDKVFREAERLAHRTKKSCSRLYRDALHESVARRSEDSVTEALDLACREVGDTGDAFVTAAAARILEKSEW